MGLFRKLFSLLTSAVVVIIVSGFLSLRPVLDVKIFSNPALAAEQNGNNCIDITMADGKNGTDPVLSPNNMHGREGGVADSGQINFNSEAQINQSCLEMDQQSLLLPNQAINEKGFQIYGWAWNTNLGDISFSCDDNGFNLGVNCGDKARYGTIVLPNGKLKGFAYGTNSGFISMSCDESQKNFGVACGPEKYGAQIALTTQEMPQQGCSRIDGTLHVGDLYGYAWSNRVGWINFCGANIDLKSIPNFPLPLDVKPELTYRSNASPMLADGNGSYDIVIQFRDKNTRNLLQNVPIGHSVLINRIAWNSTVRTDQVTPCGIQNKPACVYDGAETPAVNDFIWNNGSPGLTAQLKAIAPTGPSDVITLKEIDVTIDNILSYTLMDKVNFEFKPAVEITDIHTKDSPANKIQVISQGYQPIYIDGTYSDKFNPPIELNQASVISQLYNCSNDFQVLFANDDLTVPLYPPVAPGSKNTIFPLYEDANICGGQGDALVDYFKVPISKLGQNNAAKLLRADPTNAFNTNTENLKAVGIKAIVDYLYNGVKQIRYYSKMIDSGSILNQNADVRGNVNIGIQERSGLAAGKISQTIGENAKSKREQYYRAVKAVLRAQNPTRITEQKYGNNEFTNMSSQIYIARDPAMDGLGDSSPCMMVFDDNAAIKFGGKKTLVTIGCDIYIDANITPYVAQGELGIIALADLNRTNTVRKGGNVYICTRVTDLDGVHIVADGSLFTYGSTNNDCGANRKNRVNQNDGLPNPPDIALKDAAKNQLFIRGSLTSNNTYGGSLKKPPVKGDGSLITDLNLIDLARLYDLNYLRYAHTNDIDFNDGNGITSCFANDVKLSSGLFKNPANIAKQNTDPAVCGRNGEDNNATDRSIVNISYKIPSKDLPIFNLIGQ